MTEASIVLGLVQTNAQHISKINDELGYIIERVAIIETKLTIILLLLVPLVGKLVIVLLKNFYNNKKNC